MKVLYVRRSPATRLVWSIRKDIREPDAPKQNENSEARRCIHSSIFNYPNHPYYYRRLIVDLATMPRPFHEGNLVKVKTSLVRCSRFQSDPSLWHHGWPRPPPTRSPQRPGRVSVTRGKLAHCHFSRSPNQCSKPGFRCSSLARSLIRHFPFIIPSLSPFLILFALAFV